MLKKIKSLFIVEEESKKKTTSNPDISSRGNNKDNSIGISGRVSDSDKASVDQFLEVLAKAMENNNIKGYDYLEYKEALKSLDKIEQNEAKKYITAFTLAKTMGAEKKSLKESAQYYIKILADEEMKFNLALEKQISEKLTSGNSLIKSLETENLSKQEQIVKLEKEIKAKTKKISKLKKEVEESANKVTKVKNSFHLAYSTIVDQIQNDLTKIDDYLK